MKLGKLLFIALGLFAVLGGGAAFIHSLVAEMGEKEELTAKLRGELSDLETKERMLQKRKLEYARWQAISLPPDLTVANTRYRTMLVNLVQKHGLQKMKLNEGGAQQSGGGRNQNLTPLSYTLSFEGTFPRTVAFFTDFYTLNLPHQIRQCSITPQAAGADGKLDVTLNIEAATLPGATPRDFLPAMPDKRIWALEALAAMGGAPAGMAMGPSLLSPTGIFGSRKLAHLAGQERDYKALANKNVFAGLHNPEVAKPAVVPLGPDKSVLKEVQLAGISTNAIASEATLRNRLTNKYVKVRAEGGFNSFEIRDESNQLVLKGKAISISPRRLTFQSDGKTYALDLGQFLADALKKELATPAETKEPAPGAASAAAPVLEDK